MKIKDLAGDRNKETKFLYDFLKNHKLAVLATVSGNSLPEAAVMGIHVNEKLEIICGSYNSSRKYENIKKNPYVALVIGCEKGKTVQYEGVAEELNDAETEKHLKITFAQKPTIGKYLDRDIRVFYKIRPRWIRFVDLSREPWDKFEIIFSNN